MSEKGEIQLFSGCWVKQVSISPISVQLFAVKWRYLYSILRNKANFLIASYFEWMRVSEHMRFFEKYFCKVKFVLDKKKDMLSVHSWEVIGSSFFQCKLENKMYRDVLGVLTVGTNQISFKCVKLVVFK